MTLSFHAEHPPPDQSSSTSRTRLTVYIKSVKTYIKTNLASNFNKALKLALSAQSLLVCKPNSSFRLCVNIMPRL